jgi:hypothetical protein
MVCAIHRTFPFLAVECDDDSDLIDSPHRLTARRAVVIDGTRLSPPQRRRVETRQRVELCPEIRAN